MKEYKKPPALDAGLLAAAQAAEHYEISRYGTPRGWAEELGHSDAPSLLGETLAEEQETDERLTEIAEFCSHGFTNKNMSDTSWQEQRRLHVRDLLMDHLFAGAQNQARPNRQFEKQKHPAFIIFVAAA